MTPTMPLTAIWARRKELLSSEGHAQPRMHSQLRVSAASLALLPTRCFAEMMKNYLAFFVTLTHTFSLLFQYLPVSSIKRSDEREIGSAASDLCACLFVAMMKIHFLNSQN
jgi:hypothetical protein